MMISFYLHEIKLQKRKMKSVFLDMPECKMEIISDDDNFLGFIKRSYYLFVKEKLTGIDLQTKIYLHKKAKRERREIFISPFASMDKDLMVCFDGPLMVKIRKNPISFESFIRESMIKRLAKLIIRGKKRTMNDYYEFLSQRVVRYPLFYFWETKGFHLHHSATVEKNGKAYLFIGFNKIGKSTTALSLSAKGFKIMSDNFALVKKNKAYPYMRGMRVTDFVIKRIPNLRLKKLGIEGNKYQVQLDKKNFCYKPTKIEKIFFFKRTGDGFNCKKITKDDALEQMLNIANILGEYSIHHYISFIPFFAKTKIAQDRIKKAKELSNIPAYNVEYASIEDSLKIVGELE